jgi:hypothetical protein
MHDYKALALPVGIAGAWVTWRTGASPVAALASGAVAAIIAIAIHRWWRK